RAERPDPDHHDERRRYYRLTRRGRAVAMEETRRLERLLADARWAWRRARPGAARRRWCFSSRRRLAAFLPTLPATRVDQPIALRHEWLVAENHQGGAVEPSWIWGSGELSTN
ncbi:MAG TPA: hypothetical protein VGS58_17740, partial [Candidatus Sulfopaludibacter sp.]|nr:hypothetical protein [Candidatus Sulfopaludibacter sp.]